ncbi:hypothetical protein [Celeribacter ethanolicus]|uniref:hypothetical protein n=1 Tax=Celeribacter ethanolicus TaxID=1758178 RepID=UPI001FD30423|nr:hypothetical protein [Celeribacter ethanolicus]
MSTTKFIDTTPELFDFKQRRDRATKILTYLGEITVNGHPETLGRAKPAADARKPVAPKLKVDTRRWAPGNCLRNRVRRRWRTGCSRSKSS